MTYDTYARIEELQKRAEAAEAQVARLTRALEQWKCDTCGGRGKRFLGYRTLEGEDEDEALYNDRCSACAGTGFSSIARAALGET